MFKSFIKINIMKQWRLNLQKILISPTVVHIYSMYKNIWETFINSYK